MVQLSEVNDSPVSDEENSEINVITLSQVALKGIDAPRTMKFVGHIAGMDILALLDSGSSHSFISTVVAQSIQGITTTAKTLQVQVANGDNLQCSQELVNTTWTISGVSFTLTLIVLQLSTYDLIVGMDWLETHSPMLVSLVTEVAQYSSLGYYCDFTWHQIVNYADCYDPNM